MHAQIIPTEDPDRASALRFVLGDFAVSGSVMLGGQAGLE